MKSCKLILYISLDLPEGNGRHIVITGGSRGIGFEAVLEFLRLGYRVTMGKFCFLFTLL